MPYLLNFLSTPLSLTLLKTCPNHNMVPLQVGSSGGGAEHFKVLGLSKDELTDFNNAVYGEVSITEEELKDHLM